MNRNFSALVVVILALLTFSACESSRSGSSPTHGQTDAPEGNTPRVPTVVPRAAGHGGGGTAFSTPAELAHHFNLGIFAPEGVPLHGGVTAETDADGNLTNYGMGLFNGYGALYVSGQAPASPADFRTAADDDLQWATLSRMTIQIQGRDAILILSRSNAPALNRSEHRLLWAQAGRLLQIGAPQEISVDAIVAIANATKFFTVGEIDSANVIVDRRPNPTGDRVLYGTPLDAANALSVPVFAPLRYLRVLVAPNRVTGKPSTWEVDVDDATYIEQSETGTIPSDADLQSSNVEKPSIEHLQVAGSDAVFLSRAGARTQLFFRKEGIALEVVDLSGQRSSAELAAIAASVVVWRPKSSETPTPFAPGATPVLATATPTDLQLPPSSRLVLDWSGECCASDTYGAPLLEGATGAL